MFAALYCKLHYNIFKTKRNANLEFWVFVDAVIFRIYKSKIINASNLI